MEPESEASAWELVARIARDVGGARVAAVFENSTERRLLAVTNADQGDRDLIDAALANNDRQCVVRSDDDAFVVVALPAFSGDDVLVEVVKNALELGRGMHQTAHHDAARAQFLDRLQHGLRAPLTALLGMGDLAATYWDQWDDAARREVVEDSRIAAEHLYVLSDLLTDPVVLATSTWTPEMRPVAIADMVVAAVESVRRHRGEHVDIRVGAVAVDTEFRADPARLVQAMAALIDNAVCFAAPGSAVSVAVANRDQVLTIDVVNLGQPIPAADIERYFDAFARGAPPPGRRFNGLGVGLTTARRIARAHGGDVTLTAEAMGMRARLVISTGALV